MIATPPAVAAGATGAGVVVAVVDSGVNFEHPHLSIPGRGWAVVRGDDGIEVLDGAHRDRYGHGTCCAALIHWLAPQADLIAVRVTSDRPTTDADRLSVGIGVAVDGGAQVICVPLATRTAVRGPLDRAVAAATKSAVLVASDPGPGALPAHCPGAVAVGLRDGVDVVREGERLLAEGLARPAPGFETNFRGPSLSAARVCAALARFASAANIEPREALRGFNNALSVG